MHCLSASSYYWKQRWMLATTTATTTAVSSFDHHSFWSCSRLSQKRNCGNNWSSFFTSCHPTDSVRAVKGKYQQHWITRWDFLANYNTHCKLNIHWINLCYQISAFSFTEQFCSAYSMVYYTMYALDKHVCAHACMWLCDHSFITNPQSHYQKEHRWSDQPQ